MSGLEKWQWHSPSCGWVASWGGWAFRIASDPLNPPPFPVSAWARGKSSRVRLVQLWEDNLYHYLDRNALTYHCEAFTA